MTNTNISDNYYNPNLKVTLTLLPDAERKARLMGFAAYGVFKILESKDTIDLEYLVFADNYDAYKIGEEQVEVLLIIYVFLFGHNKVFEVTGNDVHYFADMILRAIHSKGKGIYIHHYLSKRGYFESRYYKP
jgi:hypothetical protein